VAVALAGCGGAASPSTGPNAGKGEGGSGGEGAASAKGAESDSGASSYLGEGTVGPLGSVVIDRGLHTVYVFDKDSGATSSCYDACAATWPPVIAEDEPIARDGIDASILGTTEREDGSTQITYAGRPLYDYIGDPAAAEANGNGIDAFGGRWHAIRPDGEALADPGRGGVVFGAGGAEIGLILYDLAGHTLYTFDQDKGTASTCYGACAEAWPPALAEGRPRAEGEASPGKLGTTKRRDGRIQLTYAGHPLYTSVDAEDFAFSSNGIQAFGGKWYEIRPSGERP
jgi:predicted lipoprotein with Yx(FWY)xxD motif